VSTGKVAPSEGGRYTMPDLTGLPALDLAIGLAFIFLLLSLFCSAIQEAIAAVLALRSRTLMKGLRNMLETSYELPSWVTVPEPTTGGPARRLADDLMAHPLIRSLYRESRVVGKPRLPSYISPRAFALALTDTLSPPAEDETTGEGATPSADVLTTLKETVEDLNIPANVKHSLLTLVKDARGDVDAFRTRLEAWFDDSMARVSGWYKRQTQLIILVIAIVTTVVLNANTLTIGERLWKDTAVRTAVVTQAGKQTDLPRGTPGLDQAATDVDNVVKLGVPMGWSTEAADPRHVDFGDGSNALRTLLGWFLTIVALSLGAPFWFDTLSRLSRLRSSGKPETPLPPPGRGQPNERVVTQPTPVTVQVNSGPEATAT
jgi:hypothetical protein